jgi:DUF971 family protein
MKADKQVPSTQNHTGIGRLGLTGRKFRISFDGGAGQHAVMHPVDLQQIGGELAIKWEDGTENFIALEKLRRACPCAGCIGERDIMGQLHKGPERPLSPRSFNLARLELVGGYGVKPIWADGHGSGIFSFDYLRRLAG